MDKQQAQQLIENTFERPFDKRQFVHFIKNLLNLNHIEIENKRPYSGQIIPDAFKDYISTLDRIAKYTDAQEKKIDVLIVQLKKETSLERARTMQRNFVAWYLNGSRGGVLKDAALVAFVSPVEEDWRFSLVKMEYTLSQTKTGRTKGEKELTPARRWSFLVGKNESSHTAQRQIVDILADDEHNPTLAQLEDVFNIETVTKEFFEKYRELFLWTKETLDTLIFKDSKVKADFEGKGVNTVDFAKKLLGQIVFLYFLQKKGWFGVKRDAIWGTGPKNFLRELFEGKHDSYDNFFNDILEPLCYEALSRERDDDFYSRFNCKIPFLNGGLFDPINNYDWVHTDILLTNELFSNTYKTKEGDTGNGILDIFDRYNFTVKEDEPLEKEVAVDPEMLGKVFENLLEVKDRKSKGTYYTPREIVHYMCQQSLINYIVTQAYKQDACDTVTQASCLRSESAHKQDACDTVNQTDILYFDTTADISKKHRNLPHWEQKGTAYFVTFRLYDSIPQKAAESIKQEREIWLKQHNVAHKQDACDTVTQASCLSNLPKEKQLEYHRLFSKRYDELLDNGYGCCVLSDPKCKQIVENALRYFDQKRYFLDRYIVMPNHVHVIVIPKQEWSLSKILHSWKSFTANEINKILNRQGELWMHESFDHIIRSPEQFERIRKYIEDNPIVTQDSSVTQASCLRNEPDSDHKQDACVTNHNVTQPSWLRNKGHKQDACVTIIPKEDIETLIKYGEQVGENEARVSAKGSETDTYSYKLPESIRQNAKFIDETLANIKVCDPAIGSGAFPVGMMSEIVKARNVLSAFIKEPDRTPYHFKRECIENSIYGVDIDPGAVEIAKLRLWLSLVVDEEDYHTIKPLPNLDYKIMQGNSLLEEYEGIKLFDEKLIATPQLDKENQMEKLRREQNKIQKEYIMLHQADRLTDIDKAVITLKVKNISEQLKRLEKDNGPLPQNFELEFDIYSESRKKAEELKRLHEEFFEATQREKKDELKERIGHMEWELIEATLKEQGKTEEIKRLEPLKKSNIKPFFLWKLHFMEVFQEKKGFDVVIANPPYRTVKFKNNSLYSKYKTYKVGELYSYFFEASIDKLLKDNGIITLITASLYIKGIKFEILRNHLTKTLDLIDLRIEGDNVFDSVQMPTCVLVGKKSKTFKPWSFNDLGNDKGVLTKIENNTINLGAFIEMMRGIEIGRDKTNDEGTVSIITGSEVEKWRVKKTKYISMSIYEKYKKDSSYFENDRLIIRETGSFLLCHFLSDKLLTNRCLFNIKILDKRVNLKFLLCLINSRLMQYYYESNFKSDTNIFPKIRMAQVRLLPIKFECNQQPFITLVNRILAITKDEDYLQAPAKQSQVKALEQEIDQMVYKLYDLTNEEIKIVEGVNR